MIWSTNYGRLLSQTVYTLFFAGRAFASHCIIDGKNIQDYLQEHYIEAFGQLADRISAFDNGSLLDECVIGWDSLNEPFEGLCGWENLSSNPTAQGSTLKKGTHPTPAQGLRLGMGQAQTVDRYSFGPFGPARDGTVTIDPKGRTIWADPMTETPEGVHPKWGWKRDVERWPLGMCVWAHHGVWDVETGFILREDYFRYSPLTGDLVDFIEDYWKPHFVAWARRIRASHPEAMLFVQPPVFAQPPDVGEEVLKGRCVYAPHYYDGLTLVTRHWNWFNADALGLLRGKYKHKMQAVKIGEGAIRKSLQEQLGMLKADVDILKNGYPVVIGEIGTPFDMDGKRAYGWTDSGKHKGDYSKQEKALDASLNGADGVNALSWTVWTYCTDHTHDWGDGWNMEDLSLWSPDDLRENPGEKKHDGIDGNGQAGDLYDGIIGQSRAGLLPKNTPSVVTVAASSSLTLGTLDTLPVFCSTDDMTLRPRKLQPGLRDWFQDPYGFLTNGARAFRAFVRPWPHKVVGVPVDMKFEIGKARFKLVVRVSAEDGESRQGDEEEGEHEKERLATEIYVPLVHYGVEGLVKKGRGLVDDGIVRSRKSKEEVGPRRSGSVDEQKDGNGVMSVYTSARSSGGSSRAGSRFASSIDLPILGCMTNPGSPTGGGYGVLPTDLVDLDVKVSAGRWEVEGQTLKWWYDVPGGEESREYTIEIRRRTGVIKLARRKRWWWTSCCEAICGCFRT